MTDASSIATPDLERGVDAERSRTITVRLRLLALATIGIVLLFIASNPNVRSGAGAPYMALRMLALAVLGSFFAVTYWPGFERYQLTAAATLAAAIAGLSALGGILRGDIAVAATLHIILVLMVAAVIPWGLRLQAMLVAFCALLLGTVVLRVGVPAAGDTMTLVLINAASGSLLSLFVAYQARSAFDRAARENLALRVAEESNRALNEQLEAKVSARTAELADALADQRAVTRAISHDLRQPLRHIEGFTRLLEEDLGAGVGGERFGSSGERLERIRTATARMWRMVDSLLAFSRISVSPVERRPFDLTGDVLAICSDFARGEPERHVDIVVAPGLVESCDPELVRHLLRELLGNAWKFTRERDAGSIEFGRDAGAWYVRDNGPGFDMQHTRRLFQAFERLHHSAEFEGEGMGLAICERIVRRHGGRIWAESSPGQGATFHFTLK